MYLLTITNGDSILYEAKIPYKHSSAFKFAFADQRGLKKLNNNKNSSKVIELAMSRVNNEYNVYKALCKEVGIELSAVDVLESVSKVLTNDSIVIVK